MRFPSRFMFGVLQICCLSVFCAAGEVSGTIASPEDLSGKRVAYLTGSCYRQLTEAIVKDVKYLSFSDHNSGVQALRSRKADAVLINEPMGRLFVSRFPDELEIACSFSEDFYGIAFRKNSPLTEKASAIIQEMKESGELQALSEKWCGADETKKVIPDFSHKPNFTGKNGVLKFAAEPTMEPMCYAGEGGQFLGFDVELMQRIAYESDMTFEFIPMNFGGLIEALLSGRADAVGGAMSVTKERKEKVDFAESHYAGSVTVLSRKKKSAAKHRAFPDFAGKRIGVLSGTTMDVKIREAFPEAEPVYFNSFSDLPIALESGKIEAFLMDEPQARILAARRPKLKILSEKLSSDEYAFLFPLREKELCSAFSEQIRAMKADGTLKALDKKWFSENESEKIMPPPVLSPPNGILRYATVPEIEPFTYLRNGEIVGYDIEIAHLAARNLGYGLVPTVIDWNGYLDAVISGKVRFGAACTTITEERRQKALFSESDYKGGIVIVVMETSEDSATALGSQGSSSEVWKDLTESFERTFVREQRWKLILDGLKITALITVAAAMVGTLLAFGVCAMRRSKRKLLRVPAKIYIALMQGMPILVILMILYYVVFAKIDIDAVIVAIIGFAMNFAAYVGEMFRTGIDSVPKGQNEAALALGFSKFSAFRKVILPQMMRRVLPVYKGEFVSMLKMTSIVGYIAIQDLTKMSDIIRSRTYEAFFPLIATALIYFATAHLLASVLAYAEFRLDPIKRRAHSRKGEKQ